MESVKTLSGYLFIDRKKGKFLRTTDHALHPNLFYDWEEYSDIEENPYDVIITKLNGNRIISKKAEFC